MRERIVAAANASSATSEAPVSPAQDALWLLDLLSPNSPEHRAAFTFFMAGGFRPAALQTAWQATVARHDTLRTTIADTGRYRTQTIPAAPANSYSLIDLTMVPPADREKQADVLCASLAADPISLQDGPLARLTVLRLTAADHRAVLVVHRAAADDDSLSMLITELSAAYADARNNRTPWPEQGRPTVQYADYARWQRRQPDAPLLDWWKAALTPLPVPPARPAALARPAGRAPAGGIIPFTFDPDLYGKLTGFCRAADVGPAAVLLAAWQAVLGRYGAQDLVPVCVPASVRPAEFAEVIGPFGNLLLVCGDLSGTPTFRDFAARVSGAADQAFAHRALPFARLIGALDVDHDPDRIPLGDVIFDYRREPDAALSLAGAEVSGGLITQVPVRSDLVLMVRDTGNAPITGTMAYRGGPAERAVAALVLGQLRTLLAAGLAAPDVPVRDLPLDSAERSAAIALEANQIAAGPPGRRPVHELIRRTGAHTEGPAVAAGRDEVSYPDLLQHAALIERRLGELGVSGSAVAIRMPHGAPQLAASLGTLQAGGQLIWLGAGDTSDRVRSVLTQRRPACLLIADGQDSADPLVRWYRDDLGGQVVDVTAIRLAGPGPAGPAGDHGDAATAADQVVYIAHTSGSTGQPKGIAQTHGAFTQFVTWLAKAFELGPGSRVAQWVAPDHDPSLCEVFATLVAGGTLCPVPDRARVHPERFLDWLAAERVTFLQTVPSFARELVRALTGPGAAAPPAALRWLVLMGESLPGDLVRELLTALPGVRLANLYGPTETIAATWCEMTPGVAARSSAVAPIGKPIPGREVLVLDEAGRLCPTGVTGELVIRSPHVADGYLELAAADAFLPAPEGDDTRCYRTGDLARRRPDGLLEFCGRQDQQVKIQGHRLELAEVEAALGAHPSVAECVVVPRTDRDGLVIQLVAYVVPRPPADGPGDRVERGGPQAWRAHLRARFGRLLPVSFETLTTPLPRNIAGKVDRRRLPAGGPQPAMRGADPAPEQDVARLWSQLLGVWSIGADESFFTAGGHSLLIPELLHRVRERWGVAIPVREFFANPTIAAMSALIGSQRRPDDVFSTVNSSVWRK